MIFLGAAWRCAAPARRTALMDGLLDRCWPWLHGHGLPSRLAGQGAAPPCPPRLARNARHATPTVNEVALLLFTATLLFA